MNITQLDHLVLTVSNIDATCDFYCTLLGMEKIIFADNRTALRFGQQKINLHQKGQEFEPKAAQPTPGSADLCFITDTPLPMVIKEIQQAGYDIELGPVQRSGATGGLLSVYLRDPDQNLIEIANPITA